MKTYQISDEIVAEFERQRAELAHLAKIGPCSYQFCKLGATKPGVCDCCGFDAARDFPIELTITPQADAVKPLPTALEDSVDAFLKNNSAELVSLQQERIQGLLADAEALNDEIEHLRAVAQRAQQREAEAVRRYEKLKSGEWDSSY